MALTLFTTPVLTPFLRGIAWIARGLTGWRVEGDVPDVRKLVVVVAAHTSNWDVPVGMMCALKLQINPRWFVKDSFFRPPFGTFCRWLGAVPVDRSRATNLVAQAIEELRRGDDVMLVFTPEGTRKASRYWKSGFYHIAVGAGVPIALSYLDYGRKVGSLGPLFQPTGDIYADIEKIRTHYEGVRGRYPELQGPIEIAPPEAAARPEEA